MIVLAKECCSSLILHYLYSSANRYLVKYINVKEGDILRSGLEDKRNRRETNIVPIHFAYREVDNDSARHIVLKEPEILKEQCVPNITKTCMSLYVFCDHSLYSNFDESQELLYGRSAQSAESLTQDMWPWIAKVFVDGNYKCSGVLVDLSWTLISHSCLWDVS